MAEKKLTVERSLADFKRAYASKRKLIDRQKEDFLFRLGKQWDPEKERKLKEAGINPVVDNRIQPNIFLLTGLERQNRSDFKAFPEGEEDSLKAEIASLLFKDSIKKSDFQYKSSEAFEDGVTCGESELELWLDNTYNLLNGKPCWKKLDSNMVFPEPGYKEYDYSDARYIYKLTVDLSKEDLISLFPEKKSIIEKSNGGKLDYRSIVGTEERHNQPKDYPKEGGDTEGFKSDEPRYDLLERQYKKWVDKIFLGDRKTGELVLSESQEKAEDFIRSYQEDVKMEFDQVAQQQLQLEMPQFDELGQPLPPPQVPELPQRDPNRFIMIKKSVPEIWYFAHVPNIDQELADEKAWFYPKWKRYSIIPYYAHFSTAPIDGDDRHLLIQGVVHPVKGVQEKHNSSETIKLMHLNSAQNSGWLTEEDTWVDPNVVKNFGSLPGQNLEFKKGRMKPERQFPMPLSQGHTQIAQESAEAIKQILGINADLLASQDGQSSGRAIALRQRQGLLMVQKLFDNLSRTKQICGKFLLSQLGEIYDTETAKKVMGESFLTKNFPPPMEIVADPVTGEPQIDPMTGQPVQEPMKDEKGNPMNYDKEMADLHIAEVLSGDLEQYDVAVGESVASETIKMANMLELKELATAFPGIITPDILVEESQLPQSTKSRVLNAVKQAQSQVPIGNVPPLGLAS